MCLVRCTHTETLVQYVNYPFLFDSYIIYVHCNVRAWPGMDGFMVVFDPGAGVHSLTDGISHVCLGKINCAIRSPKKTATAVGPVVLDQEREGAM
jgi:hypothetical protein